MANDQFYLELRQLHTQLDSHNNVLDHQDQDSTQEFLHVQYTIFEISFHLLAYQPPIALFLASSWLPVSVWQMFQLKEMVDEGLITCLSFSCYLLPIMGVNSSMPNIV